MFDITRLEKYDSEKMFEVHNRWPQIAKECYESNVKVIELEDIDHIVFAGMGGSGALGDLFFSILSKTSFHVSVIKGYHLPSTVNSKTLVVTTSVSGNTIETLSVLKDAHRKSCKIIGFSDGGKMEEFCNKNNIEYRKIQKIHSPRASFTAYLYGMLASLTNVLPIKETDVKESISAMENLQKKISSSNLTSDNSALELAEWIDGIPLIYYPWGLQSAAIRFKNSLQENAKMHAMAEDVLEACHNGIVSWEKPSNVKPILLEGKDDYIKTKERWKILKEYFEINRIDYREINSLSGNVLSKIVNLIYLLDYTSIYRAVLSEIDPSPIKSIDFIKSKLN